MKLFQIFVEVKINGTLALLYSLSMWVGNIGSSNYRTMFRLHSLYSHMHSLDVFLFNDFANKLNFDK